MSNAPGLAPGIFTADGTRTGFNGFEAIPNDRTYFTGGSGPYVEDGIQVEQVNSKPGNPIWIGYSSWAGAVGNVWYPNGGDNGYTSISLVGGANFQDVGFNLGAGAPSATRLVLFELYASGSLVLSGSSFLSPDSANYLGFSGGGFDTILLRDNLSDSIGPVNNGAYQALAIDNIETQGRAAVPEQSSTFALVAGAMIGLVALRGRFLS